MAEEINQDLKKLGERVSILRARRGLTRKNLALIAGVSERHLANLEYGLGNASFLVLLQISNALECTLAELIGDPTTLTPEWLMIRELLINKDETSLRQVRLKITELLQQSTNNPVSEIQSLYGMNAYRRYERRALEETIQIYPEVVIATPGGIVSDPASFNLLLAHCTTVWLQAKPEEHMQRVIAQGDMRPMADSKEAMDDLKKILDGRKAFYSKAQLTINTSLGNLEETFVQLMNLVKSNIFVEN